MSVTRRTIITAGAIGAIGAIGAVAPVVTAGSRAEAAQMSSAPVRIVRVGTTSPLFGPGHQGSSPFEELRALSVCGPADQISGSVVVVTFDARTSSVTGDETSVQIGGSSHQVAVQSSSADQTGELRLQLPRLARTERDVQVDVTIPLRRTATFPDDAVEGPVGTTVQVRSATRGTVLATSLSPTPPAVPGRAWGAQLAAVWQSFVLDGTTGEYAVPAFVRVTSVGPGPVPKGTVLRLTFDRRLVRITSLQIVSDDGVTRTDDARVVAGGDEVVLLDDLETGGAVTLAVTAERLALTGVPADVTYASVSIASASGADQLQRITGAETCTALSPSAVPRTSRALTGRI